MSSGGLYSRLTSRVSYKTLAVITPVVSILVLLLGVWHGVELGIDFAGGTWMEVLTDRNITGETSQILSKELSGSGLSDVKVYYGFDMESGLTKLTVATTSVVNETSVKAIVGKYAGTIVESDYALVPLSEKPPADLNDKLEKRFNERVDIEYASGVMTVAAVDLDKDELSSALEYYLNTKVEPEVVKKNFNSRSVGPTLGKTFRDQAVKAMIVAYILMGVVVFMSFRDMIPSFAVMLCATLDVMFAFGGMVLLGIPLEPASLAALIMLIGYSVDTDILLTARTIKQKTGGAVNEQIDDAIMTGLTMTGTTIGVMVVVIVVSLTLTQITTLYNIATVLLVGLVGDVFNTWLTNAGLIKWYVESPAGMRRRFRK